MSASPPGYRLSAVTGTHRGDREYQQDQVAVLVHPRERGCLLAVLADGMGGKSGGRKAADQVMLTARQLFEHHVPGQDEPERLLRRLADEAHTMIRLTAVTAEEEPHSTLAAVLLRPNLQVHRVHAGDSRVYHFRGADLLNRSRDHSLVQRYVDEGRLSEEEALCHPQSHLLTACLGTPNPPPVQVETLSPALPGDTLLVCSDGLWHYFSPRELGAVVSALKPGEAIRLLIDKARERARGGGDNLSLAILRIDPLPAG